MSTQPKKPYHHGDLKTALLGEAAELLTEKGMDGFTLRELARRLGVTHSAVYRHFSTKQAILASLATDGQSDFRRHLFLAVQSPSRNDGLAPKITSFALAYLEWARKHDAQYQLMFGPRLNETGEFPDLESAIEQSFLVVDSVFTEHGFSKDRARELSVGLMTLVHGYWHLVRLKRIRVGSRKALEEFLRRVLSPYIRGICAEAAALKVQK